MTPSEITQANFDKSGILEGLLADASEADLLGELQVAFVSLLLGESAESFAHWKALLVVLCNSEAALVSRPQFFERFLGVLYSQLGSLPEDLFFDPFLGDSFLPSCLAALLSLLDDPTLLPELYTKGQRLKRYVQKQFGVAELMMGDPEEAPALVETSDCQKLA